MSIKQQIDHLEQLIRECSVLDESEQSIAKRNYAQQIAALRQKQNKEKKRRLPPTSIEHAVEPWNDGKEQEETNYEEESTSRFEFNVFGRSEMKAAVEKCQMDRASIRVRLRREKLHGRIESLLSATQSHYTFTELQYSSENKDPRVVQLRRSGLVIIHEWYMELVTNLCIVKGTDIVDTSKMSISEAIQVLSDEDTMLMVQPDLFFGGILMTESLLFRLKTGENSDAETNKLKALTNVVKLPFNYRLLKCTETREMDIEQGMMIFDSRGVHIHLVNEDEISRENTSKEFGIGPLFMTLFIPYGSKTGTGEWWRAQVSDDMWNWLATPAKYVRQRLEYLFPNGSMSRYKDNFALDKSRFQILEEGSLQVEISYDKASVVPQELVQ